MGEDEHGDSSVWLCCTLRQKSSFNVQVIRIASELPLFILNTCDANNQREKKYLERAKLNHCVIIKTLESVVPVIDIQ